MASNPAQLENCKRMKISGLMLALLMVLTPALTLGTASAGAGGGSTVADVCDNDDLWLSEVHPEGGPNDWIEIQHDSNLTCSMEGWKLYDQDIVDANGADDAMILTFGYLEIDHIGSGGSFLLGVKDDVSFPYTFEFDISSNGDAVYLESPDGYTVLVATLPSWASVDKSWQNCRDSAGIDSWGWTGANRAETPGSINDCSPINGTLPDMIVSDIYLSGSSNVLTIEVSNIGNGDVPAAEAAGGTVYIWIDQFSQPDWTYSWTTLTDTSFIVAGGMANIQPQTLSGTHYVQACVDVLGAITESNENNNCHIMNLTSDEDLDDNSTGDDNNTDPGTGDDNNSTGLGFEPITCENNVQPTIVEILSSDMTTHVTSTGLLATEITAHPAWTASIGNAKWVWNNSDGYGYIGIVDFYQQFSIPQNAQQLTGYMLVAADNSYEVDLNNQQIGMDSAEYNFVASGVDAWSLDPAITTGVNTLDFAVDNWHVIGGLMYGIKIQYCLYEGASTGDDNNTGDDGTGDDNNTGDDGTGDDNNTDPGTGDDNNTGDDGTGDDNNTGDDGTGDNETGNLSCQLTLFVNPAALYAGDTLTLSWTMTGSVSSQVYISVFSGWGTQYYHSSIEPNTGSFSLVLPSNLDPSESYYAYIESAENGQRTTVCWEYQAFDVLEEEPEACNLTLTVTPVALFSGDTLTLSWTMTGSVSSQVYISVFSGWGAQYYHSSIEPNTGSFSLVLPSNLDPSESYHAYIESAENGQRTTVCWKYAAFDVLEVAGPVTPEIDLTLVEIIDDEVEGSGPCDYSMLIVSDSNTQLMDDTGAFGPSTEYTAHPAWVNVVGAEWIWTTPKTATGAFTFVRPIQIPMDAYNIEMDLQLSADNGYAVSIVNSNGVSTLLDSDWTEFNYQSITTLTSTDLTPGLNHLVFVVNNSFSGPGGLTYRADIDMCRGMCNYSTTIVSDSLTLADGVASQLTPQHSAWVNPPAGSSWIWDGSYGYDFVQFTRGFQLPVSAYDIEGTLLITADNAYNASMNGQFIGSDWTEFNFLLVESYSLTGALQPGYNQLGVDVLNMHVVGGLAYAMNITWCQEGHGDPRDHPPVYPPVDEHDHTLEDHHAYGHDEDRGHSHDHEDGRDGHHDEGHEHSHEHSHGHEDSRDGHHDEDRCGWCEEEEAHTSANCVYPEYDNADSASAESCHGHGHGNGHAACCQNNADDCAENRGGDDDELSSNGDGYNCGCSDCLNDGKQCLCEECDKGSSSEPASIPDGELGEEESDEEGFVVPGMSEDKQLVAAGAGAGSTLSLLGLALRRRLTGGL